MSTYVSINITLFTLPGCGVGVEPDPELIIPISESIIIFLINVLIKQVE